MKTPSTPLLLFLTQPQPRHMLYHLHIHNLEHLKAVFSSFIESNPTMKRISWNRLSWRWAASIRSTLRSPYALCSFSPALSLSYRLSNWLDWMNAIPLLYDRCLSIIIVSMSVKSVPPIALKPYCVMNLVESILCPLPFTFTFSGDNMHCTIRHCTVLCCAVGRI